MTTTIDSDEWALEIFTDACHLYDSGRLEGSAALFRVLAEAGEDMAQDNLANILDELGRPDEAVYWYRRAVRRGNPTAALNLATHYRNLGKRRWYIHWLKVAVKMGDEDAGALLDVATNRHDVWWAVEGVEPPPFVKGPRLVRS
jgi:TPR repeat protein